MKINKFYTGYNRFWHWTQMLLVILLTLTGWEVHGSFEIFGYKQAVLLHNSSAYVFVILTIFSIFWMLLTGEIKQYLPTFKNMGAQIKYYLHGIFHNHPHPVDKTPDKKLNPLQRMVYFLILVVTIPLQIVTGLVYMYFHLTKNILGLERMDDIAIIHTIGAYLFITFLVVHVYLISTGKTVASNLKAMIVGYEKEELEGHKEETKK